MPDSPNKLSLFWQELKDRRVIRTTTVYVAVGFGLLEMIDIISGSLNFPDWVLTAYIFIFAIGFPVTIILSWIYHFGPDGIKRYKNHLHEFFPEAIEENTSIQTESFTDPSFADGIILFDDDSKDSKDSGKSVKHTGRIYGISSLTVICLAVFLFLFYGAKSASFNERDWVVLADFVNHTDEMIFDKSLSTAFEISIDQSRYINVVPRQRVLDALKRIGKESGTVVDEALCREIAIREGAKAFIVPEISRVGRQYILTGKLQEAEKGIVVTSEIFYIKSQDKIIGTLDRMSKKMRRHLGESRYKISGQSKPLEKVTTSSLDALKQYSIGHEYHLNLDFKNAATHYTNAISLDSTFTSAKAILGSILYEKFDRERGKKLLDEAIQSIDDLTDNEKYSVLSFYAGYVEKDLDKSIEYTKMIIESYPDNASARNNLGWYFQNQGRYKEAIVEYKTAVKLDPYALLSYGGLIWNYLEYLGQMDSAVIWSKRMLNYGPENAWAYYYLGSGYFGNDELGKAREAFEKARVLYPGFVMNLYRLAQTYRILGKFEQAVEVLKNIAEISPEESPVYYNLGICYQLMGANDMATDNYLKYKRITEYWEAERPDNPFTFSAKGAILSRLGNIDDGMEAGKRAYEMDTTNHIDYAKILAIQNNTEEALDHLEIALEHGYRNLVWLKMDPDLSLLQDDEHFLRLLEKYFN